MINLRQHQSVMDQLNFVFWCCGAMFKFLLEHMQRIDRLMVPDSLNGAVSIAALVFDQLHHASAAEPLKGLC